MKNTCKQFGAMRSIAIAAVAAAIVFTALACGNPAGPDSPVNPPQQQTDKVFRLVWQGELKDAPANPVAGWVYFDLDDQKLYVYYEKTWHQLGTDGSPGSPGTPGAPGAKGDKGDTGAKGDKGDTGAAGSVITISADGYWVIDGVKTEHKAIGEDGKDGTVGSLDSVLSIGENGNWFIGGEDTLIPARGEKGADGLPGEPGATGPTGPAGTQLVWKGSHANSDAEALDDPEDGWLYYDQTAKASFIYYCLA